MHIYATIYSSIHKRHLYREPEFGLKTGLISVSSTPSSLSILLVSCSIDVVIMTLLLDAEDITGAFECTRVDTLVSMFLDVTVSVTSLSLDGNMSSRHRLREDSLTP